MTPELLQIGGSLGVGTFGMALIFLMYRKDKIATEKRIHDVHEAHSERLESLLEKDQETREENTKALTELNTFLVMANGRRK